MHMKYDDSDKLSKVAFQRFHDPSEKNTNFCVGKSDFFWVKLDTVLGRVHVEKMFQKVAEFFGCEMFSTTRRSNPCRVLWGILRVDFRIDPGYIHIYGL